MRNRSEYLAIMVMLVLILTGCDLLASEPVNKPTAADMVPNLPGYNTVEGQTLTDYLSVIAGGASLLAGQPELAAAVAAVDGVSSCYQSVGAVAARAYSNQAEPLSAGVVAIADRNALLDPANLFQCVAGQGRGLESVAIEPCSTTYTLPKDDNEFYILYAGSTQAICHEFCAQLEGCTAH